MKHAHVFALGDVSGAEPAAPPQQQAALPATAQVAFQQADYAAWNVWAAINGRPLLPFRCVGVGAGGPGSVLLCCCVAAASTTAL
jgi:NADH:ubiquinone reductase (non-electrogenic)